MNNGRQEEIIKISESIDCWEKLKGKTVLISGATGFVGQYICDVIRYRNQVFHDGIKIISLTRRGGVSDETVTYVKQDINQSFNVGEDVDYVLHLASNTHPKQYAEDPVGTITTNVFGCHNLLQIASEKNARFVLASSVEIYGQGSETPMAEDYCGYIDCNQARSGYNESKRVCESLCQSYRQQFGTDVVIARLSRLFGPDPKTDTKAMSQFMDKAVANEDIVLKSKGNQRYSYCYVSDAVSALFTIMLKGTDGEAYNVSADDEGMTLGQYAEYIASLAGHRVVFQIENNASVSKATYALMDAEKLKKLGWKPEYSVKDGLKRTYDQKCALL